MLQPDYKVQEFRLIEDPEEQENEITEQEQELEQYSKQIMKIIALVFIK